MDSKTALPVVKPCPYRLPLKVLCCSAKHKELDTDITFYFYIIIVLCFYLAHIASQVNKINTFFCNFCIDENTGNIFRVYVFYKSTLQKPEIVASVLTVSTELLRSALPAPVSLVFQTFCSQ